MTQRYYELEALGITELNTLLAAGFSVVAAEGWRETHSWWSNLLLLGPANRSPYSVLASKEFR